MTPRHPSRQEKNALSCVKYTSRKAPLLTHAPMKCNACSKSRKGAGCFQAGDLFKGNFIFNVDMYLDFTAEFDMLQSQCHSRSVKVSLQSPLWSCAAFPSTLHVEVEGSQREASHRTKPSLTLNPSRPKLVGFFPECTERATSVVVAVNRINLTAMAVSCPAAIF